MSKKKCLLFISGTGRSGTHLIGRIISSHQEVVGRIEVANTFGLITRIATTQDFKPTWYMFLLKQLLKYRLKKILKNSNGYVLEKSHPSLWMVDYLLKQFTEAKFIFVYREMEPTVSSMLEHKGVLNWYKKLPQNKPNRFLGITDSNKTKFENYSIEEKCALRWQSHFNEIFRLKDKYPNHTLLIKYDDFLTNPDLFLEKISNFVGLENAFFGEKIKIESLDKWKHRLSENQISKMKEITSN